ncbi:glucokinase [Mesorhizobium sp. VNQ89]|uniref:glucokinase n=1 Tax=Mesorhizobium quangtriensis TaxID=3157709 RepID=UPI0032B877E4
MTGDAATVSGGSAEAFEFPILVGDIGGTNARFAVVEHAGAATGEPQIVHTADFPTIDDAIRVAVIERLKIQPRSALLALAGPVIGDEIPLTNCPWVVKPKGMAATVGLTDIMLLNDFEAQALAVVALGDHHVEKIGGADALPHAGRAVLGPGTGLGVAGLIKSDGKWIPVPGEGGHMDIGPRTPRDYQVWPHIEPLEGRVSGEQILSGRGLVNTYRAIAAADAKSPVFTTPAEITKAALDGTDVVAQEALSLFVTCLGRTAGDVALVFKAQGGVYLAGGIAQRIIPALKAGNFRAAFNDKAPHSEWMADIPIYVITDPLGALAGLATYAREPHAFGVETAGRRWRN